MSSPTTRLPFLRTEVKLTVLAICPSALLFIPLLYATIARGGIPLTEISFSHPSWSLSTGERGSLLWTKISCQSSPYHYNPICSTINHLKNFP
uniref:Uncharacterized protein n=1 Tax=Populus trichocarpa TaxID=3694 RepID=A0A2K1XHD4_POPTR